VLKDQLEGNETVGEEKAKPWDRTRNRPPDKLSRAAKRNQQEEVDSEKKYFPRWWRPQQAFFSKRFKDVRKRRSSIKLEADSESENQRTELPVFVLFVSLQRDDP